MSNMRTYRELCVKRCIIPLGFCGTLDDHLSSDRQLTTTLSPFDGGDNIPKSGHGLERRCDQESGAMMAENFTKQKFSMTFMHGRDMSVKDPRM
jgi:hypothetical protein